MHMHYVTTSVIAHDTCSNSGMPLFKNSFFAALVYRSGEMSSTSSEGKVRACSCCCWLALSFPRKHKRPSNASCADTHSTYSSTEMVTYHVGRRARGRGWVPKGPRVGIARILCNIAKHEKQLEGQHFSQHDKSTSGNTWQRSAHRECMTAPSAWSANS